jgi:hypothetical protein
MKIKKILQNIWLRIIVALLIGFSAGVMLTRWYDNRNDTDCGSISYYDKSGDNVLYSDHTCLR